MNNNLLSLKIPGANGVSTEIEAPSGVPTGGLSGGGGKAIGFGLTLLLIAAALLTLGFLMYGGFLWMSSSGDKQKVEGARRTIIYAIVGLIVCILSFFIISLFGTFFGTDLLNLSL